MKPKRLALYIAGAAIAVSAAYFFWPDLITAASTFEKSAASTAKGETKGAKGEPKVKASGAAAPSRPSRWPRWWKPTCR